MKTSSRRIEAGPGTTWFVSLAMAAGAGAACRWMVLGIILVAVIADASIVGQSQNDEQDMTDLTRPSPAAIFSIEVQREPDSKEKSARLRRAAKQLEAEIQHLKAKYQ